LDQRREALHGPFWDAYRIRGAKHARELIGYSLTRIGKEIARIVDRDGKGYHRRTVWGWENGAHMTPEIINAYGVLIANALTKRYDRSVGVSMRVNSPWVVRPFLQCAKGHWYQLRNSRHRRCSVCGRE
jgi:hypothetical protein